MNIFLCMPWMHFLLLKRGFGKSSLALPGSGALVCTGCVGYQYLFQMGGGGGGGGGERK